MPDTRQEQHTLSYKPIPANKIKFSGPIEIPKKVLNFTKNTMQ